MLNESDFDMSTGSAGAVNGDANPDAVFANNGQSDRVCVLGYPPVPRFRLLPTGLAYSSRLLYVSAGSCSSLSSEPIV